MVINLRPRPVRPVKAKSVAMGLTQGFHSLSETLRAGEEAFQSANPELGIYLPPVTYNNGGIVNGDSLMFDGREVATRHRVLTVNDYDYSYDIYQDNYTNTEVVRARATCLYQPSNLNAREFAYRREIDYTPEVRMEMMYMLRSTIETFLSEEPTMVRV